MGIRCMEAKERNGDFVAVPKDTFRCMISDFEHLLKDFEDIAEAEDMKIAERRLSEIKEGKAKVLGEKEFRELMKKEGVE